MKEEKTKRNFSIRLPEEVIALLDEIASNTGLNITRNNVVEQACEWFVRTYRANGNRALTAADMLDLETYLKEKLFPKPLSRIQLNDEQTSAEAHGDSIHDPSDKSVGGLKTAKTQTRYQPKRRKSSS